MTNKERQKRFGHFLQSWQFPAPAPMSSGNNCTFRISPVDHDEKTTPYAPYHNWILSQLITALQKNNNETKKINYEFT